MKIDTYVLFMEHPSRFGLRVNMSGEYAASYLKVVALPEMTDSQVLRLALDNVSYLLERLRTAGVTVDVHLDQRPPVFFKEGPFVPRFGDDDDGELRKSIDGLKKLLASPRDLRFRHSPNGRSMI